MLGSQRSILQHQMVRILLNIFCLLLLATKAYSACQQPQKVIYLSLNSLSNRDHLEQLFLNLSQKTTNYSLTYTSTISQQSYDITDIRYELAYNHHYQREEYLDEKSIRVQLGVVNVLTKFTYKIKDNNQQSQYAGVGYARSYLEPAFIEKELVQRDGVVEWQARIIELLEFKALWVCQPILGLPFGELHLLEKMLNNIVPVSDIKPQIQAEINLNYRILLKNYLNADQIFSTKTISYTYRNISLTFAHQVRRISIDNNSSGLVAFLSFGVTVADQKDCGRLPQIFSESDYGGIVQIFTLSSVKLAVFQALRRGLFDVKLDKNWQSSVFQFFMGDLANAVPYADKLNSIQPIQIQCSTQNLNNVTIAYFDENTIYLEAPQQCRIQYSEQNLISVSLQLIVLARLTAGNESLKVKVDKVYSRKTVFSATDPNFIVQRQDVGQMIVQSLLDMTKSRLNFGTNFPLLFRKYPSIRLTSDYLIVFDASEFYAQSQKQHKSGSGRKLQTNRANRQ